MVNIVPITKKKFLDRKWLASDNYKFSAHLATATLAIGEISQAMRSLPIGFVQYDGYFTVVAILGLNQGENLFVSENGNWLTGYKPAIFRSYPFSLRPGTKDQMLLSFDEDSLSNSDVIPTNRFYDDNGDISEQTKGIMSFLYEVHNSYNRTVQICKTIDSYNLFDKWNISIKRNNKQIQIDGIYKINEDVFRTLDGDALLKLNKVSALGLIYAHIFSGANINLLEKLANYNDSKIDKKLENLKHVEQFFSSQDDNLDFSKL